MTEAIVHPGRRLGRRPPKRAPSLALTGLLTGAVIPRHPESVNHLGRVFDWGMYGNDRFGTCGPTSLANYYKMVTTYLTNDEVSVSESDVYDLYRRSGNPNFDPDSPWDDNGVDMQTMLEAFMRGGMGGIYPLAFASVDVSNLAEVDAAIAIFGGMLLGVDLQVAQQAQTDGHVWDYEPSAEWGGHAVVAAEYAPGRTGWVSWAQIIEGTDQFMNHQLDEAWVVIMPEHLGTLAFLEGVDRTALEADYTALTGRPFPDVEPSEPAPSPVAGLSTLVEDFLTDTLPWAVQHDKPHHSHSTRAVAHAIVELREATRGDTTS